MNVCSLVVHGEPHVPARCVAGLRGRRPPGPGSCFQTPSPQVCRGLRLRNSTWLLPACTGWGLSPLPPSLISPPWGCFLGLEACSLPSASCSSCSRTRSLCALPLIAGAGWPGPSSFTTASHCLCCSSVPLAQAPWGHRKPCQGGGGVPAGERRQDARLWLLCWELQGTAASLSLPPRHPCSSSPLSPFLGASRVGSP